MAIVELNPLNEKRQGVDPERAHNFRTRVNAFNGSETQPAPSALILRAARHRETMRGEKRIGQDGLRVWKIKDQLADRVAADVSRRELGVHRRNGERWKVISFSSSDGVHFGVSPIWIPDQP
jgi:hypothetical protein